MDLKTVTIWFFIGIVFLVLTNIAFAHCIKRDFKTKSKKTFWCIVSLIPFIGFIFYFLLGARKGVLTDSNEPQNNS
ncbi:MAG: PLDc N-terminal domain-containing protein [Desulforegulaceae bacterium]|nr:PLDc N-terminal domain-containing protein [Desulforegulaceae bacterium]